jgi:hypothetical protein
LFGLTQVRQTPQKFTEADDQPLRALVESFDQAPEERWKYYL